MKRNIRRRILNLITNLRFSIILLLTIASVTIIGTIVEQDKNIQFYQDNYPVDHPVLGFLSWKVIFFFGIDHLYTNWWFYSLMFFFCSSLLACTFSTQLPLLKVARTWKFLTQKPQFSKLSLSLMAQISVDRSECTSSLNKKGYLVFQQKNTLYAYKGLLGRISPIFVHFSIILILFGAIISASTGFIVQEVIPKGEYFHVQNLISSGNFSFVSQNVFGKVDDFRISYNENGSVKQFFSTLSLQDLNGNLLKQETIYVNKPLRYNELSIYQTDWNITGLKISVNERQLQLGATPNPNQKNVWITSFSIGMNSDDKYFFVMRDLNGEIDIYNKNLVFLSTQKIGSPFVLGEFDVNILDIISSTGLQIKSDPGIPIVYMGFFFLILSSFLSYLTYSQIWLTLLYNSTVFGGTSNRDVVSFEEEFYVLSNFFLNKNKKSL